VKCKGLVITLIPNYIRKEY